nr:ribokinase [Actinomyces sp.]
MDSDIATQLDAIQGNVVVCGSLNADLTVRTERFPKAGETVAGRGFAVLPGGKSANQAVQASLLGAQVQIIGSVGRDAHGELLLRSLRDAGVGTEGVKLSEEPTGTALITVEDSGANTIVVASGANATVDRAMVEANAELVCSAAVLGLCMEVSPQAVEAAAVLAHQGGTQVVFNNSPVQAELSPALLEAVDVLVVNEHELRAMAESVVPEEVTDLGDVSDPAHVNWGRYAAVMSRLGLPAVVVTLGGAGAVVLEGEEVTRIAPHAVDVVDTTGAGDSFLGTLLAMLASGSSLVEAARLASAVAAYATRSLGAQASYGDRTAIARYWAQEGVQG